MDGMPNSAETVKISCRSPPLKKLEREDSRFTTRSGRVVLRAACLGWRVASVSGRFLLNKTIDVFICVDRFDVYRQDNLDRQVIEAISDSFGNGIWRRCLFVLTHAQFTPPAEADYEFSAKRSETILKFIRLGAYIKTREFQVSHSSSMTI
ncbi:hypothetical protein J5N97_030005 [Dioscorea zingiberensis]|uniref:AIG1-type G domain-containing protein n=1 Tax=Dioscorea zingiberensis TaxID=325984 RepID=A0A9D5H3Q2_9LILI|nr:hypothetical protein J5N97_030005 [Dioscorea zingiberensis]